MLVNFEVEHGFDWGRVTQALGSDSVPNPGDIVDVTFTQQTTTWQFPDDPYVDYDKDDEQWARVVGFGKEVVTENYVTVKCAITNVQLYDELSDNPKVDISFRPLTELNVSYGVDVEGLP